MPTRKEIIDSLTIKDFLEGDVPKNINGLRLMADILEEHYNRKMEKEAKDGVKDVHTDEEGAEHPE